MIFDRKILAKCGDTPSNSKKRTGKGSTQRKEVSEKFNSFLIIIFRGFSFYFVECIRNFHV
jgi:hypothetical protein